MKVAHVGGFTDPRRRSGRELLAAWPTLSLVARAVADAGPQVAVFQAAARDENVREHGVAYDFVGAVPPLAPLRWLRLARRVGDWRPDVVHLHGLAFPLLARLLAASAHAPLLVQDHADRPFTGPRRLAQRWGLAGIDAVAFVAPDMAVPFHDAGVLPESVPVLAVPESSTTFSPAPLAEARARTGIHGEPAILWVGRLDAVKDPLTALHAFDKARCRLPDAQLWCCFTEAPLLAEVEARLSASPDLRGRVHLLGAVPHADVEALCRAADLFLAASRREGSGYALLEALACGTPAVVTDIPAFRMVADECRGVTLTPVADADAMADAILRSVERAGDEARRRVRADFERALSPRALGRRLVQVYEALAAGGAA